jgi:ribosomal protein S18 acetylase RimI-like enzyme
VEVRQFRTGDLDGVLHLCGKEGWTSLCEDPERAHRVLMAPGVTSVVAEDAGSIVGFAYLQSDGEIQAHLSLIAVDGARRRQGIGRKLVRMAFEIGGGRRLDLITEEGGGFYESFSHRTMSGYRIYPAVE